MSLVFPSVPMHHHVVECDFSVLYFVTPSTVLCLFFNSYCYGAEVLFPYEHNPLLTDVLKRYPSPEGSESALALLIAFSHVLRQVPVLLFEIYTVF
jgi:hypothetical protein